MPDYLAAPRPATVALAQIPNSRFNFIDLHPSTQLRSTAAIRSSTAIASISALKRLVSPQTLRLRRANPHSARGTAASSPSRFPPLEVFRRRPSACAAPSSWAGIRKPSQDRTHAVPQKTPSFDRIRRNGKQYVRDCRPGRLCGVEVDDLRYSLVGAKLPRCRPRPYSRSVTLA